MDWEKIFVHCAFNKGLISKIYKHTTQYSEKTSNSKKKNAEDLNRYLSKADIQMANRQVERCSILLIMKEGQIKTTMRHRFTLVRMAIIKKSTNNIR